MRVLLTGAAGFIGSQVARALVVAGQDIHALVRPGADTSRLAGIERAVRLVEGDLLDHDTVERVVRQVRPQLCVHLAWYVTPGRYLEAEENLAMVAATLDLARELAGGPCERFVGTGTCFEYDTSQGYLSEESATGPRHLYSACKLATFEMLSRYAPLQQMQMAWVRPFYQYGPYESRGRLVPEIVTALLRGETARATEGTEVRDYLHVADVGRAVAAAALSRVQGAVNIGSGTPVTTRKIVETVASACGRPDGVEFGALPSRPGEPTFICANITKLQQATGWQPLFTLESGIRDTVEWWTERLASEESR